MKRLFCMAAAVLLLTCALACEPTPPVTAKPEPTATVTFAPSAAPTETPTKEPTAAPTPTATTTPTMEPTPQPITAARLDAGEFDGFFDDALFVGDSMTRVFGNFIQAQRARNGACLGTAQFMGEVSMTVRIASTDDAVFTYRGKKTSLTAAITKRGVQKVFLMLGGNDIGHRDWDAVLADYGKMIDNIKTACRDVMIIVQGVHPGTKRFCENRQIDIAHWNRFNEALAAFCETNGVAFYSFAEELMDEQGYLRDAYASGDFHFSDEGNAIWLRAARIYAARQCEPDAALDLSEP